MDHILTKAPFRLELSPVGQPLPSATTSSADHEVAARRLEATGRYRILRQMAPRPVRQDRMPLPGGTMKLGIILDTETTGLDSTVDEVVEIAMLAFSFDDSGTIHDVVDTFEGMQQPTIPLSSQVSELTGITEADLAGKAIDRAAVADFVRGSDLIIAHNARFDRPFCEKLAPCFADLRWACSFAEVDWKAMGFQTAKLGALLAEAGLFHDAHRALADCQALLEVLTMPSGIRRRPFLQLLASSSSTTVEISAERSPFSAKDILKERGYRWSSGDDGRPKAWRTVLPETRVEAELEFLRMQVYRSDFVPPIRRLDAVRRYRSAAT